MGDILDLARAVASLQQEVSDGFKALGREIGELKLQIASFSLNGHASTQLHCKQLEILETTVKEQREEIEELKDSHRALVTKVAVIVTAIGVGGSTAVNVISKFL